MAEGIEDHKNIVADGVEYLVKGLTNFSIDVNTFLSDVVDEEGPILKQIHCSYFTKYPVQENTKLKFQIDQAEWEVLKINQARLRISEELQIKEAECAAIRYQLKPLILRNNRLGEMLKCKKIDSLGKLFRASTLCCEGVFNLCWPQQELSDLHIQARWYKLCTTMYHGCGKAHDDMAKHTDINSQLKLLSAKDRRLRTVLKLKMKVVNAEQEAQGRLCRECSLTNFRSIATALEGERNDLIGNMLHQMQHGSRTLAEEKKILREINQFVGCKETSIANETITKGETQSTRFEYVKLLARKKAIEDGINLNDVDLEELRKEKRAISKKIKLLEEELKTIDRTTKLLMERLEALNNLRSDSYGAIVNLYKAREKMIAYNHDKHFYLEECKGTCSKEGSALEVKASFLCEIVVGHSGPVTR